MGNISLSKNAARLVDSNGRPISKATATYFWAVEQSGSGRFGRLTSGLKKIDLDVSAIAFNDDKEAIGSAHKKNFDAFRDGSIVYGGDTKAGAGGEANESVTLDFDTIPDEVRWIAVIITAPSGASYGKLAGARIEVTDDVAGETLVKKRRSIQNSAKAALLVRIKRVDGGWDISELDGSWETDGTEWRHLADQAKTTICV